MISHLSGQWLTMNSNSTFHKDNKTVESGAPKGSDKFKRQSPKDSGKEAHFNDNPNEMRVSGKIALYDSMGYKLKLNRPITELPSDVEKLNSSGFSDLFYEFLRENIRGIETGNLNSRKSTIVRQIMVERLEQGETETMDDVQNILRDGDDQSISMLLGNLPIYALLRRLPINLARRLANKLGEISLNDNFSGELCRLAGEMAWELGSEDGYFHRLYGRVGQ